MVSGYAYRGFISPLDEYFTAAEKAEFTPALVNSGTYDGKFYSPPLKNSCHVLWYNKNCWIRPASPTPRQTLKTGMTWEQVVELSQKIMAGCRAIPRSMA